MNLREIDRLVAEKVMGLKIDDYYFVLDEKGLREGELLNYSTNIEDAWRVVERFDKTDFRVIRNYSGNYSAGLMYWNKDTMVKFEAKAETAPLAICLAALKSVGVEVDN
jgi:Phage ABA sandwich domain